MDHIVCDGCKNEVPIYYNQCPLCGHMLLQQKREAENEVLRSALLPILI